ncbi:MFS glucose transporter [Ophiocordyceps camponoti-floridani]|uniref:MFS glucose transporter n=1 Tax=Ophiocordyceps camponoti-floridani TaxID=2030778 RepID=A0A8H4Q289_9HYPO|nr:MFS glucose transporter [Ophiocordyceps camponoti-floridani]
MAGRGLRSITAYFLLIICIVQSGPLQFGFHIAELNAPQDVITCRKKSVPTAIARLSGWPQPPSQCIPMNEATFAFISSIFTLGALAGALASGPFSSRRGRRLTMRLTAAAYLVGSVIEAAASNAPFMSLGRFLSGLGAGASTVVVPLYVSETSPPSMSGLFGAMTQISINFGILATQVLGYFLSHGREWRWILAVGVVISSVQAIGLLLVPESPAWLATHGHVSTATQTLQRIRGKSDIDDEVASWGSGNGTEHEGLLPADADGAAPSSASQSASKAPVHLGFIQVVKDSRYRPAIVALVGLMMAQQCCGINAIIMYSVSLFADVFPTSSALLTILISVVNLAMTAASAPLPDRLGRKTCLLISTVGQGTSALLLALSIVFGWKLLSAIAVLFFVAFFAVGLGPIPFILASELVDQEAVGAAQSWCLSSNYVSTFLVSQFFLMINTALNEALGGSGWVFFLFAALAAGSTLFVYQAVPETVGKRGMQEVWGRYRRLD